MWLGGGVKWCVVRWGGGGGGGGVKWCVVRWGVKWCG